jgi:hypothetical protein
MDNLSKARQLFQAISGKQRLGVFTHRDGNVYFEGRVIDPTEQVTLAKKFEETITLKVKTI